MVVACYNRTHNLINVVPAMLNTSGYAISAHCIGVASMFNIISQKTCTKCGETKPLDRFHKKKWGKYGRASECKECSVARNRKIRQSNPKQYNAYSRKWKAANWEQKNKSDHRYYSENKEKVLAGCRRWQKANTDKVLEFGRRWYKSHVKEKLQTLRGWKEKNPDKVREQQMNRRMRKLGVGGTVTAQEWKELKEKYKNTCLRCHRSDVKLTMDHVIPISLGGTNTIGNIQPLCKSCNCKKHAKIIDYRR
jgi:5-methylcytosine-specific restriction endonuclease McrA